MTLAETKCGPGDPIFALGTSNKSQMIALEEIFNLPYRMQGYWYDVISVAVVLWVRGHVTLMETKRGTRGPIFAVGTWNKSQMIALEEIFNLPYRMQGYWYDVISVAVVLWVRGHVTLMETKRGTRGPIFAVGTWNKSQMIALEEIFNLTYRMQGCW